MTPVKALATELAPEPQLIHPSAQKSQIQMANKRAADKIQNL